MFVYFCLGKGVKRENKHMYGGYAKVFYLRNYNKILTRLGLEKTVQQYEHWLLFISTHFQFPVPT